jgi:uncharacterized protein (DUF608 family)
MGRSSLAGWFGLALLLISSAFTRSATAGPPGAAPAPAQSVSLGGLGAGAVTLQGDGRFGPLTINNNWARPIAPPPGSFFALRVKSGDQVVARTLSPKNGFSWPGLKEVRAAGDFPLFELTGEDPELPVSVRCAAFSPLIPQNLKDSSLPVALFSVTVTNRSDKPVEAAVALSWENVLGLGGTRQVRWADHRANAQQLRQVDGLTGLVFSTAQSYTDQRKAVVGEYALLAAVPGGRVSALPYWNAAGDGDDFWSALTGPILFEKAAAPRPGSEGVIHPAGAVAGEAAILPGQSQRYDFVLGWHMPNDILNDGSAAGHYYATFFDSAWAAASYALQYRDALLAGSGEWRNLVLRATLPEWLRARLLQDAAALGAASVYTRSGYFALIDGSAGDPPLLSPVERRTAWQPFLTALFPALDRQELATVAGLQYNSGELPRLTGSLGDIYGRANFPGAASRWPDVACGFILQTARHYRWTGDSTFLASVYPGLVKALGWLRSLDTDGDGIPEGDTAAAADSPGTHAYTASLYLAALRAVEDLATRQKDNAVARRCQEDFQAARRSAVAELWNGRYFNRFFIPTTADRSSEVWWGQLAGQACAASLDLSDVYGARMIDAAVRHLQGEANGARTDDPLATAYLTSLAVRSGDAAAALRAMAEGPAPAAGPAGLASWNVLYALSGAGFDESVGQLAVRPQLPAGADNLQVPVFGPRAWFWLDCQRSLTNANVSIRLKLVKRLDDRPIFLRSFVTAAPIETSPASLGVLLQGPRGIEAGKVTVEDDRVTFVLRSALEWVPGQEVTIDLVTPDSNQLLVDAGAERAVSFGSAVRVEGVKREREAVRFTLVNPTPERQVVNLRFQRLNVRDHEVYLNGFKTGHLFDNEPRDRLAVVAGASPVAIARINRLKKVAVRLQTARETIYREGKLPLVEARLNALQGTLDQALRADAAVRAVEVTLVPDGSRYRPNPTPETPDVEKAVAQAEEGLRQVAAVGPKDVPDARARTFLVSAVVPVEGRLVVAGSFQPRGTVTARLTLRNESDVPLTASIDPILPAGWSTTARPRLALAAGQEAGIEFPVQLPEAVESRRYRVAALATVKLPQTSWDVTTATAAGNGFIREWSIIGPFPNGADRGLSETFPPEKEIVAGADYNGRRWRALKSETDRIDLGAEFTPNSEVVAFAYTRIFCPVEQDALIELGSSDGVQVTLNGGKVFDRHTHRAARPGQDRFKVHLKQGWNALLVKTEQATAAWGFYLEVTDLAGAAIEGMRLDPAVAD